MISGILLVDDKVILPMRRELVIESTGCYAVTALTGAEDSTASGV